MNRQHRRFLLDEKPISWHDTVWLEWHADDGYMLERYSEADESLLSLPDEEYASENAGEAEAQADAAPAGEES